LIPPTSSSPQTAVLRTPLPDSTESWPEPVSCSPHGRQELRGGYGSEGGVGESVRQPPLISDQSRIDGYSVVGRFEKVLGRGGVEALPRLAPPTSCGQNRPVSVNPLPGSNGRLGRTGQAAPDWTPHGVTCNRLYLPQTGWAELIWVALSTPPRPSTFSNLPTSGVPIYARLWSLINGGWQYLDYTYTPSNLAPRSSVSRAGSQLTVPAKPFQWIRAAQLRSTDCLWRRTGGGINVYSSGDITATQVTVAGLAPTGEDLCPAL